MTRRLPEFSFDRWVEPTAGAAALKLAARADGAANEVAVVALPIDQGRKGILHAHFVRVPHKDGGHNRVDEAIENFRAELALDECRERFFLVGWLRRAKDLSENAPLGAGAHGTGGEQSLRREGSAMERTVTDNVALGFRVTAQEFGLKIEVAHQTPGGGRETRELRTGFVEELALVKGGNHATGAMAGFEEQAMDAQLL